ncbi:Putative negative regulator of RcsB-dependent stress response [Amphritea atlantica]|uniref:Ancillary SecYEG translocon subunit n=2 Tax=Amphritea atlantica TaxID=355243 RepID=A0A1H9L396_9GAMM|nr:Putative negative regulator of RcsB-dependent stress response [Amphritea atlantica]
MSDMRTEEEQVEALKNWWKENGKSLVLTIALALAVIFGWKAWQNNQRITAENAGVMYQNLVQAVALASAPQATDDQRATASHLAKSLKDEYGDTTYALFGALFSARLYVDAGDYAAALTELDWVLAQSDDSVMKTVATMRKARVMAAMGDADKAIALLDGLAEPSFSVSVAELKGDLYLQTGEVDKARAAYQSAATDAPQGARPLLTLKLDSLAVKGS